MDALDGIPVLDVGGLTDKEQDLQKLAQGIKHAFTNIGFVAIVNHNVSMETVDEAWKCADQFFALSDQIKAKYRMDSQKQKQGWSPIGSQTLYKPDSEKHSAFDFREALDINPDEFDWPMEVPDLKHTTVTVMQQLVRLANYILKLMAMALELKDRDFFTRNLDMMSRDNPTILRYAQYPPIPEGGLEEGQMRCAAHTDWGSITLLLQDQYGGLEVQRKDGTWVTTKPPPGTIMVNVADLMQRWTSDVFVSTNHRVREPEDEHQKQRMRRSLVLFGNPDSGTVVECVDGSNKYPPIISSEYFWMKSRLHLV